MGDRARAAVPPPGGGAARRPGTGTGVLQVDALNAQISELTARIGELIAAIPAAHGADADGSTGPSASTGPGAAVLPAAAGWMRSPGSGRMALRRSSRRPGWT